MVHNTSFASSNSNHDPGGHLEFPKTLKDLSFLYRGYTIQTPQGDQILWEKMLPSVQVSAKNDNFLSYYSRDQPRKYAHVHRFVIYYDCTGRYYPYKSGLLPSRVGKIFPYSKTTRNDIDRWNNHTDPIRVDNISKEQQNSVHTFRTYSSEIHHIRHVNLPMGLLFFFR